MVVLNVFNIIKKYYQLIVLLFSGKIMKLIRNNDEHKNESTKLSDSEFIKVVFDQISSTALEIKNLKESEQVLSNIADILELLNEYVRLEKRIAYARFWYCKQSILTQYVKTLFIDDLCLLL